MRNIEQSSSQGSFGQDSWNLCESIPSAIVDKGKGKIGQQCGQIFT